MESFFSKDYFALFNLPVDFNLDSDTLTKRYCEMQGTVHPDRFVNATEKERRISVQMTALLNEAYHVLKAPLTRARYLLTLRGIDIDDSTTRKDIAFLTEQMELRERLDDLRHSDKIEVELMRLGDQLQRRLAGLQETIQGAFEDDAPEALERAHRLYDEMQFISRLNDELIEIEDALD